MILPGFDPFLVPLQCNYIWPLPGACYKVITFDPFLESATLYLRLTPILDPPTLYLHLTPSWSPRQRTYIILTISWSPPPKHTYIWPLPGALLQPPHIYPGPAVSHPGSNKPVQHNKNQNVSYTLHFFLYCNFSL